MFPGWMGFQPGLMGMPTLNQSLSQSQMDQMLLGSMGRGMPSGLPGGMQMPGMEGMPGLPSRLPDSFAGKTEEEKQRAVVVKALKEIADTEKTKESLRPKEEDSEKKPSQKVSEAAKPIKCFLHQKPNKNCKKCQQALSQQAAEADAAKETSEVQPKEALDADEVMRRSNKSGDSSEKKNIQCSPMLKEQIIKSSYFKSLMEITSVDGLINEIVEYVDTLDVYNAGSKTSPSCFMCHIFRLSVMPHLENDLGLLIDNREYAVVRCVGFVYLRFVTPPTELQDALEEYLLDDMELVYSQDGADVTTTIGEYVESLLTQDKYFDTPLPRLPVKVRQTIEERVAPMWQHRKRMAANREALTQDTVENTSVEVCMDGTWLKGTAKELVRNIPSRVKVKVRLEGGADVKVHLGKVVLIDASDDEREEKGRRSRSRSRGRARQRPGSHDWSRWKGKSDADMLQELRERNKQNAVCGHGKSYSKRPLSFDGSMASTALAPHDTVGAGASGSSKGNAAANRRSRQPEEDMEVAEAVARRKRLEEDERQRKLASVYKKYCATPSAGSGSCYSDVDKADKLRLG